MKFIRQGLDNARLLPRFLENVETRIAHARKLERVCRQTDGDLAKGRTRHTAADTRTLRGIPAVGRGVAGVVMGTQPETEATR